MLFCASGFNLMGDTQAPPDLPPDALVLVAHFVGIKEAKRMRGVCKGWQQGFELGVKHLRFHKKGQSPPPPSPAEITRRFPGLISLDLGGSAVDDAWLDDAWPEDDSSDLASCTPPSTRNHDPNLLPLLMESLDLGLNFQGPSHPCQSLLKPLGALPLTHLRLGGCLQLTDSSLKALKGLKLSVLDLTGGGDNLTPVGLEHLRGMPLTELAMGGCNGLVCDAGMQCLRELGFPLNSLSLAFEHEGFPTGSLGLGLTDAGLEALQDLPLVSLSLRGCSGFTDGGLAFLADLPLTALSLSGCQGVRGVPGVKGARGRRIWKIPTLTLLDVSFTPGRPVLGGQLPRPPIPPSFFLDPVEGVSRGLSTLSLNSCPWVNDRYLEYFDRLTSLTSFDVGNCVNLTDIGARFIMRMPFLVCLNIRGCPRVVTVECDPGCEYCLQRWVSLTSAWDRAMGEGAGI